MTTAPTGRAAWIATAAAALVLGCLAAYLVAASAAPGATVLLLALLAAEIWVEVVLASR
jgi:hypothetical protein